MTFETILLIGMITLGIAAYTWFVVELAWELVIRRMDRYEQAREEELAKIEKMMQ